MAITQIQPFNIDSSNSYTFGNVTSSGNISATGNLVASGNITVGGSPVYASVTISSVQIATASWVVKDDTAVSTSGGYLIITGTGFTAGCNAIIGSVNATSVSVVSSTTLRVTVPAQAAGTYTIYVVNTNGSIGIIINGVTYSGDPTWVTGSTLTSGQVNSAISIQLSATGDAPITYALQAGSSLPSGLSLTSGGLLSGTVTGITVDTTYNFTIEAIDAQAQESPRAFSITITANDQYFMYVSLLLSANNPTSTFVSDASTNAFAITVTGDTRPNNFGPYLGGYYGVQLSGSNYLTTASSNDFIASGVGFTAESWVYYTALSNFSFVLSTTTGTNNYNPYWFIGTTPTNWRVSWGNATAVDTGVAVVLNSWHHVAMSMSSAGAGTFYLNGVSIATTTGISLNGSATAIAIGHGGGQLAGSYTVTGYISNARYVRSSTVYTAAFTPSTTPLTAIANTSLLTCQSNRFIDTSANALAITATSTPLISGFVPFVPASATSTYGSGYFSGSGSLTAASNVAFSLTGDFTIECWVYLTTAAGTKTVFTNRTSGANATGLAWVTQSGSQAMSIYNAGAFSLTSSISITLSAWTHIALTRSGSTMTQWVNGVSGGTSSNSNSFTDAQCYIGVSNSANEYWPGYITDFRIVKGTAVYTTTFTPPAAPLTAIANTSLLTLQNDQPNNNSMFVDNSTSNFLITRNGNTTQGSFSPYAGGYSVYTSAQNTLGFTSSGTGLNPYSNKTFTIEFWIFPSNAILQYSTVISKGTTTNRDWAIYINQTSSTARDIAFYYSPGSGDYNVTSSASAITYNTWQHVAVVSNNAAIKIYVNGTQVGSGTQSQFNSTNPAAVNIGRFMDYGSPNDQPYIGYVSNIRYVTGTALYTTAFTPSTAPLTAITGTSLLMAQSSRFVDNSINNFTITASQGSPSVQKFSPFSMQTATVPTSYSVIFNGSTDIVTPSVTSVVNQLGTSNFTVECWFYSSATPAGQYICDARATGIWAIGFGLSNVSGQLEWWTGGGAIFNYVGIAANTWYHVAVVRSGTSTNQMKLYVNGVNVASATDATNYTGGTGTFYIGNRYSTISGSWFQGNISNFRIVPGVAVYTGAFTPPTSPLAATQSAGTNIAAITGTQTALLTCQSATIIDNSTNSFTITVTGSPKPNINNPFGYTNPAVAAYTITSLGGSMYFDGTGDYLTLSNTAGNIGTTFTVEFWAYLTTGVGAKYIINNYQDSGTGWIVGTDGSGYLAAWLTGDGADITGSTVVPINSWNHIALSGTTSSYKLFLNGVQQGSTYTGAVATTSSSSLTLGQLATSAAALYTGYVSDVRIIKGQNLYTSNFVPSLIPLTAIKNSTLLLNGTGAGIYDSSMNNDLETVGGAIATTSIEKYGNTSLFFNGTNSGLFASSQPSQSFGSSNFTIEFWYYPTSTAGTNPNIMCNNNGASAFSSGMWSLHAPHSTYANKYSLWVASYSTSTALLVSTSNIATNSWTFVTITRSSNTWRMFINGTIEATATHSGVFDNGGSYPRYIGYQPSADSGRYITGYIDDLRMTNGIARYTANFTAPSSPYIQY